MYRNRIKLVLKIVYINVRVDNCITSIYIEITCYKYFFCGSIFNKSFNSSLNKMGGTSGGRYIVTIITFRLVFSSSFEISAATKSMF